MRVFLVCAFVLVAPVVIAQQIGQYTHFPFNYFHLNPAVAGTTKCPDIRLGYRHQWLGFENDPRTAFASVHGSLGGKNKLNKSKHGIGAFVEADQTGPLSRTALYFAYAYHFQFNRRWMMSFGAFVGFQQYRFNVNDAFVPDPGDPVLASSMAAFIAPDITPGVYFYDESWTFGISMQHAIGNRINSLGEESTLRRHFALMASKQFGDSDKFTYTPAMLFRVAAGSVPALDLNMMVEYKQVIGLGLAYRNGDAVAALMRVNFLKYFALAYAFDLTTSRIRVASANTHEITLGISVCTKDRVQGRIPCAAYR
ncbi:MAG: type IX secretion system membrane protein PorP/SprF [Cryomorphaceae bacterium]|nr:MAG: type IX secretion system membrane protein PorP/SprF [Cryomorphaceae bacterium]